MSRERIVQLLHDAREIVCKEFLNDDVMFSSPVIAAVFTTLVRRDLEKLK